MFAHVVKKKSDKRDTRKKKGTEGEEREIEREGERENGGRERQRERERERERESRGVLWELTQKGKICVMLFFGIFSNKNSIDSSQKGKKNKYKK